MLMAKIKTLKSWDEDHAKREPIAPRTHVKAVYDDNGDTLDSLLGVQDEKISELGSELGLTIQKGGNITTLEDEIFKDIYTFPKNKIYSVLRNDIASQIANIPEKAKTGFSVITISASDNAATSFQILFDNHKNIYMNCLWGSTWSEWININDINNIKKNSSEIDLIKSYIQNIENNIESINTNINNNEEFSNFVLGLTDSNEVSIEKNEGYISKDGKIVSGTIGFYSNNIHIEQGTIIKYRASASSAFSAISKVENGKIVPLVLGITGVHEIKDMYYFAENEMDVIFSGYSSDPVNIELYNGDSLPKKVLNLTTKVNSIYGACESIIPKFSNTGYIKNDGTIQSLAAYKYSEEINLKKGQTIIVKTNYDYIKSISIISLKNKDNTYTSVVTGGSVETDENGYRNYSYIAETDCEVVLSTRNTTKDESYAIIIPSILESVNDIDNEVNNLKKEIGRDKYGLQPIDGENPLFRINTSAGLTSAIRSWGFVGDSLSSGEIWGYMRETITLIPKEEGYKINTNGEKESAAGYNISEPFKVSGVYPMVYSDATYGDIVFVKSDAEGYIGAIIPTSTNEDKIYTKSGELASGNYVRISYPNTVNTVELKKRYVSDNYDISWGQFLCRLCGSEGYNYSTGGRQAKTIVNETTSRDLGQLLKDTQKQAYTIALGQNDYGYINGVGDDTHYKELGSAEEGSADLVKPSNPSNHGDSFVGYYSELICRIKNQFNDSLIFLITCPNKDGSRDEISAVIRQIYEHYNKIYPNQIFLIDLNVYAKGLTNDFKLNGLHLNSQGYLLHAYVICTYVDWILRNNIEALNGLPLIGTGAEPK
jgi:hypothetical protein